MSLHNLSFPIAFDVNDIDMKYYRDMELVANVYRRLNSTSAIVDVDDTISYLDDLLIIKRIKECEIMTEIDSTGSMRLRSIMCSKCYKLFNFPEKKMLQCEEMYYCVSCKEDGLGKKDTIRNFFLAKSS